MAEKIIYRHNVMDITSLDTFFRVRGGFNNNIRDVYFVRALGECHDFLEKIQEIDKRMGMESLKGKIRYLRIGELSSIPGEDKIRMYAHMYDQWKHNKILILSQVKKNDLLNETIAKALLKVEEIYRHSKRNVSDSILRNFSIKLLFWLEDKAGLCFHNWSEKSCIKILLENVVKEQEYMFGYFLSLLGCDVLLLENRGDVNIPEEMEKLSKTMILGNYGTIKLCQYVPPVQEKRRDEGKPLIQVSNIPKRATVVVNDGKIPSPIYKREIPEEKSFEELAKMASSIVMITVHGWDDNAIGTGSGIMIGRKGYILTNYHVVEGGKFYSVRMEDDEEIYFTNEIIKYNWTLDMAVIRINKELEPLFIYRGSKKLVRGQKVVAIGSPLGLFNSVSDGIISGFRKIRDTDMIQFTAPTSPGSSGGAVLNMYGEVIGISTAGIDKGQNINLAVGYENILMFAKGFLDHV